MIVFIDTSTLLAASWSAKGLSRLLIGHAPQVGWTLVTADDCVAAVEKNVGKHRAGGADWRSVVPP